MSLSPAAAAKIAGVSRSLISRSIKSGELRATRRNNGHQSIQRDDLEDWMSRRTERATTPPEPPQTEPVAASEAVTRHADDVAMIDKLTVELAQVRERLAGVEGEARATAARIEDLGRDRDAWRAQAERLASEPRPVGFLARLLRRS